MKDTENKNILINTQDRLTELFNLALRVNQETPYCIFVNMSGHVDSVEFIFRLGKKNGQYQETTRASTQFYYDCSWDSTYQKWFIELCSHMHGLLEKEKVTMFKAEAETNFTTVSKTFQNEADRAIWMGEVSSQFKVKPEFKLSELTVRR